MKNNAGIDPAIIRFGIALVLLAVFIEIVDNFSHSAAWTLFIILILGLLLNNPLAIALISAGGQSLSRGKE
jgi:hypothetical protein